MSENKFKDSVKCPRCRQWTKYSPENKFRPFCSERCRLIDLGQWADGTYAIPVEGAVDMDFETDSYDEPSSKNKSEDLND